MSAIALGLGLSLRCVVAGDLPEPRVGPAAPTTDVPPGDVLRIPGRPDIAMPPGTQVYPHPPLRGEVAAARPPAIPTKQAAGAPPQAKVLDDLFGRLAKSTDASESEGIASAIRRVWLRSGSDTADLLMTRAGTAMGSKDLTLAEKLLDAVVALEPDWAEGWNRRATVRFDENDDLGAMADIAQVLVREPRHFGALSGMGYILERHDMHKAALKVFRRVLALYPQQDDIRKIVNKLAIDVEGRDI